MDPISIGLGIAGLGMSLFGGASASGEAGKQAALAQQQAGWEQRINDSKLQQARLQASRMTMESFRNTQRARAQGLAAATSQGAQFGSGYSGGQAQISNQGANNILGLNQNLSIGEDIAAFNYNISGINAQMAQSKGSQASYQAMGNIGNSLMSNANTLGSWGKDASGFLGGIGDPLGGFGGSSRWGIGG